MRYDDRKTKEEIYFPVFRIPFVELIFYPCQGDLYAKYIKLKLMTLLYMWFLRVDHCPSLYIFYNEFTSNLKCEMLLHVIEETFF